MNREDYLVSGRCAKCGGNAHDVHEIIAGANRQAASKEPACWLRLCRPCHQDMQGLDVEYQLAHKFVADTMLFNLRAFSEAWCRPISAVDTDRLLREVQSLLNKRYPI